MTVRRAHSLDVQLCEDDNCKLVHVTFADDNDEIFAEFAFHPTRERAQELTDRLHAICWIARSMQEKKPETKPVAH